MTDGSNSTLFLKYQELRRSEGFLSRAAVAVILLACAAIFYVWCHDRVVKKGMELNELRHEWVEVKQENDRLCLERNTQRNLKRIEKYATDRLGMIYPDPSSIRVVRESR